MSNKNFFIPQNIMELQDENFFDFVKQFSGEKVSIILEFQDISDVNCLLACNDPFEILSYDSNDLLDLKKKTCVKLNNNSFAVLPGIKSKMNLLKNALMKKCGQLKKEMSKTTPNISITNSSIYATNLVPNNPTNFPDGPSQTLTSQSLPSNLTLAPEEKIKQYLIESLNEWCRKTKENKSKGQQIFQLKENADYEIIIDTTGDKVLIKCDCGATSTLGQKNNIYILSNYIRHLTNRNPCSVVQQKLKHINELTSNNIGSTTDNTHPPTDLTTSLSSELNSSIQISLEKRKRNPVLHSTSTKKRKNN